MPFDIFVPSKVISETIIDYFERSHWQIHRGDSFITLATLKVVLTLPSRLNHEYKAVLGGGIVGSDFCCHNCFI